MRILRQDLEDAANAIKHSDQLKVFMLSWQVPFQLLQQPPAVRLVHQHIMAKWAVGVTSNYTVIYDVNAT